MKRYSGWRGIEGEISHAEIEAKCANLGIDPYMEDEMEKTKAFVCLYRSNNPGSSDKYLTIVDALNLPEAFGAIKKNILEPNQGYNYVPDEVKASPDQFTFKLYEINLHTLGIYTLTKEIKYTVTSKR